MTCNKWVKALIALLITTEVTGLALIAFEAKLLIDHSESLHWVGYTGAGLMSAGAFLWAKIFTTFIKPRG